MEPFDRRSTSEADFYTLTEGTVKCQMMDKDSFYPNAYFEELDADAIKIPFQLWVYCIHIYITKVCMWCGMKKTRVRAGVDLYLI